MCGSVQHMCLQCYVNTYKNVYIIYTLYMDYTELTPMPVSIANIKQHRWRERQLDIFYRTGRPIFNMNINNMHLRTYNNPSMYKEPNHEFWQSVFRPYIS